MLPGMDEDPGMLIRRSQETGAHFTNCGWAPTMETNFITTPVVLSGLVYRQNINQVSTSVYSWLFSHAGRDQNGGFFLESVILVDLISRMPPNSIH